ncbi:MAG: enhanced serine sensitivity protein SseB C-terminal domain-containing protein [Rhizomicrobium sp.]
MLFIAENELEKALVEAVKAPSSAPEFYRLLLETNLLVMGTVEGQEEAQQEFSLSPGGRLSLVTALKDGSQYLPVFSSLARMQEFVKQESKYLSIKGRALLELTLGGPLILNPASQYGKELSPQEVQQLLSGPAPHSDARVIAGEADYPMPLVQALMSVFATRPDIETAWMIQVTFADRAKQPHPLVGIELDAKLGSDWSSLLQAIQAAAETHVPDMLFDIQRVDRRNPAGMTSALTQAAPFYVRGANTPTLN